MDPTTGDISSNNNHDNFECTACAIKIANGFDAKLHPLLEVLVCKKCYKNYGDGDFAALAGGVDANGDDEFCRWCADGGSLVLCQKQAVDPATGDRCHKAYCETCILRNFPNWKGSDYSETNPWICFACDPQSLADLRKKSADAIRALTQKDSRTPANRSSSNNNNNNSTSTSSSVTASQPPSRGFRAKRSTADWCEKHINNRPDFQLSPKKTLATAANQSPSKRLRNSSTPKASNNKKLRPASPQPQPPSAPPQQQKKSPSSSSSSSMSEDDQNVVESPDIAYITPEEVFVEASNKMPGTSSNDSDIVESPAKNSKINGTNDSSSKTTDRQLQQQATLTTPKKSSPGGASTLEASQRSVSVITDKSSIMSGKTDTSSVEHTMIAENTGNSIATSIRSVDGDNVDNDYEDDDDDSDLDQSTTSTVSENCLFREAGMFVEEKLTVEELEIHLQRIKNTKECDVERLESAFRDLCDACVNIRKTTTNGSQSSREVVLPRLEFLLTQVNLCVKDLSLISRRFKPLFDAIV